MKPDDEPLPGEFLATLRDLERSYLAETDPIRQSGFGGGPQRWLDERGLILDALHPVSPSVAVKVTAGQGGIAAAVTTMDRRPRSTEGDNDALQ